MFRPLQETVVAEQWAWHQIPFSSLYERLNLFGMRKRPLICWIFYFNCFSQLLVDAKRKGYIYRPGAGRLGADYGRENSSGEMQTLRPQNARRRTRRPHPCAWAVTDAECYIRFVILLLYFMFCILYSQDKEDRYGMSPSETSSLSELSHPKPW